MALQIVAVNDASPGACVDVGFIWDGSTTLTATQIIAGTSCTMSGTLAVTGNVAVNTDKFTVTADSGNTLVAGTLAVTGAPTFTGAATCSDTLTVDGASTLTGAVGCGASVTLGAGADIIGSATSDITINTDKFTVAGATGNTVIAGTTTITGALTQTGAVGCAASITLGAGADIIGSSTSDITINTDKFTVAGATGNTVVAGTLTQTGASGFAGIATFAEAVSLGATNNAADNGAVALDITEAYTGFTTNGTGALAATLADGTIGQVKILKMVLKDVNDAVVTPANFADGTTITFSATGQMAIMVFAGTTWEMIHTTAAVA